MGYESKPLDEYTQLLEKHHKTPSRRGHCAHQYVPASPPPTSNLCKLITAFILLGTFYLLVIILIQNPRPICSDCGAHQHVPHETPLIPPPSCNYTLLESSFELTFSSCGSSIYCKDLVLQETLQGLGPNITSKIHFTRANSTQKDDIRVQILMGSTWYKDFERIQVSRVLGENEIHITSLPPSKDAPPTPDDACTYVHIIVYITPAAPMRYKALGNVEINASLSSIELGSSAKIEIWDLHLSTKSGDIVSNNVVNYTSLSYLSIHKLHISTQSGRVFGNWSFGSILSLSGGTGEVNMNLTPYTSSYGPWTSGDIYITTISGNVSLKFPYAKDKLSMRDFRTYINSTSGSIWGKLFHGSHTHLQTLEGNIDVEILPYGLYRPYGSNITTISHIGNTDVRVLSPVLDSYYKENPLNWTDSSHTVYGGDLKVRYPDEWTGWAQGKVRNGSISLSGDKVRTIEKRKGFVSAHKGWGGSFAMFEVNNGSAEVQIGEEGS